MTRPAKKPNLFKRMLLAAVGYYHGNNSSDLLLSDDEDTICKLQNDGRLEIRRAGTHVRWL